MCATGKHTQYYTTTHRDSDHRARPSKPLARAYWRGAKKKLCKYSKYPLTRSSRNAIIKVQRNTKKEVTNNEDYQRLHGYGKGTA